MTRTESKNTVNSILEKPPGIRIHEGVIKILIGKGKQKFLNLHHLDQLIIKLFKSHQLIINLYLLKNSVFLITVHKKITVNLTNLSEKVSETSDNCWALL